MHLNLDDLLSHSLAQVADLLKSRSRRIADVTFSQLVSDFSHNGVYVFGMGESANWAPNYVGKASSRLFFERFGGHFDPRSDAFMNSMLRKLSGVGRGVSEEKTNAMRKAAETFLSTGTVVTIRVIDREKTKILERALIDILVSTTNSRTQRTPPQRAQDIWTRLRAG